MKGVKVTMANSNQVYFLVIGFCVGCLFTCFGGYESSIAWAQALVHAADVSYNNIPHEMSAERVQSAIEELNTRQNGTIVCQGAETMATTTTTVSGAINELVNRITTLEGRITALQTKTASMSMSGNTLTFTGANVHVRNGSGSTSTANATGNVFVGYNEDNAYGNNFRDGSHNFVLGPAHSYVKTSGFVAGEGNFLNGLGATCIGGMTNAAIEDHASVHGGWHNWAENKYSATSGGYNNRASHDWATVSGGDSQSTTGPYTHTPDSD